MRKLAKKLGAMAKFSLKDDSKATVGTQGFKVKKSHAAQFFPWID
jgi:hypothetical protein